MFFAPSSPKLQARGLRDAGPFYSGFMAGNRRYGGFAAIFFCCDQKKARPTAGSLATIGGYELRADRSFASEGLIQHDRIGVGETAGALVRARMAAAQSKRASRVTTGEHIEAGCPMSSGRNLTENPAKPRLISALIDCALGDIWGR